MEINFANDLGYSTIKGAINDEEVKIPSVTAELRKQDILEPTRFKSDAEKDTYFDNLFDHMDVTIQSPQIKTTARMLVGQVALNSGLTVTGFDVNDFNGKSETDRSLILTLATIATKALKEAYKKGNKLSNTINANVNMTTALPVTEGKKQGFIQRYRDRFTNSSHLVTFHNFDELITVKINFNMVVVALEGETAQYEITNASDDLQQDIQADLSSHYPDLADMKAKDIISLDNAMLIDIGEGTTDFIIFQNGQLNAHISNSIQEGYGNALEEARDALLNQNFNVANRASLQEKISRPAKNLIEKRQQSLVKQAVSDQLDQLKTSIVDNASKTLRKVSGQQTSLEIIYVLGGGSIPMNEQTNLRTELSNKTNSFSGNIGIPVVFISKRYAQYLNEDGLKLILQVSKNGNN